MTIDDRRLRDRAARRHLILSTARAVAEREGWDAVTTRRLSSEIEYSQPVIYQHFASLDDLAEAIAIEGFDELADALGQARRGADETHAVRAVADAYVSFASDNPALYDVMFTRATRLRFGTDDAPASLPLAFDELRSAVAPHANGRDIDTLAEVLWASLHGLVLLDHSGRLRPGARSDRIDLLVAQVSTAR